MQRNSPTAPDIKRTFLIKKFRYKFLFTPPPLDELPFSPTAGIEKANIVSHGVKLGTPALNLRSREVYFYWTCAGSDSPSRHKFKVGIPMRIYGESFCAESHDLF